MIATGSGDSQYSTVVNGDTVLLAGSGASSGLVTYDISNPASIELINRESVSDKGGYVIFQDGFAHLGASGAGYFKIDMREDSDYAIVGQADFVEGDTDLDFVSVMGNVHARCSAAQPRPNRCRLSTDSPSVSASRFKSSGLTAAR